MSNYKVVNFQRTNLADPLCYILTDHIYLGAELVISECFAIDHIEAPESWQYFNICQH